MENIFVLFISTDEKKKIIMITFKHKSRQKGDTKISPLVLVTHRHKLSFSLSLYWTVLCSLLNQFNLPKHSTQCFLMKIYFVYKTTLFFKV